MKIHTDPMSSERHTLELQPQALFLTFFPRQGDPAARRYYAMPGQARLPLQRPHR